MPKSFQKAVVNPTNKFFKKSTGEVNRFFKKGGAFQKGVGSVASGLGSVGRVVGQGVRAGNQIVGAIEKSPYGSVLAPATAVARTALGVGGMASSVGNVGKHVLKDVISGGNAGEIVNRTLQSAKQLEKQSNTINFNPLEKAKPKQAEDTVQFV